jgi:uncharacterized LabA/DUF88 family protein
MGWYAGFIDAGYLRAAGGSALDIPAPQRQVDAPSVMTWLATIASEVLLTPESRLLRCYWYEGAYDPQDRLRYSSQQPYLRAVANTPGVQLRLGHLQVRPPKWQYALQKALDNCGVDLEEFDKHYEFRPEITQKGVDTLIVLDLVRLAEERAYDTAILLAGDRDLAEAVRAVQAMGRRVVLAHPERAGVAPELRELADWELTIPEQALKRMVRMRPDGKAKRNPKRTSREKSG